MDREVPKSFAWLPEHMPGVAKLVREKRRLFGDAHVSECWRRGVLAREPGWFFAVEGSIAIGTPDDDERLAWFASLKVTPDQVLVVMKNPEVQHGA